MADANIELKSENPFMVGGFKMQSSTKTTKTSNVIANDASGFVILEDNISKQSDYTQSMTYCGSNFLTDALFLSRFGMIGIPLITEANYWKGSQITITGAGEGNGVYTFSYMFNGKPIFEKQSPYYNSIYFNVDRWYMWSTTPEPDNAIYRQTAANAWPWEGTWEVVPGSGATDAPDTPSPFLGTDGTAYWTGMKVNVSGAGTTLVNGDLPFTGWAYGKPQFALGLSKTVYAQSDGKYKIVKGGEPLYLATTVTDWPWEATYALIGGSSGVNPAPTIAAPPIITGCNINATAGQYVTLQLTGHNHPERVHGSDVRGFNLSTELAELASWDGFGVPDMGVTTGNDASPTSLSISITCPHQDVNDADGTHLIGYNQPPKIDINMGFEGIPTSKTEAAIETDSGFIVDSVDESSANSAFKTFAFSGHQYAQTEI